MSIESADEAVQHLYKQLATTEYKSSSYWTTAKNFKPTYQKINTDFVLDTTLVPPQGIEPRLPVPQTSVLSIIR